MMKYFQKLGKSLMLPVAALPVAGILMGIGYWLDPSGWGANSVVSAFLLKSGGAIIDNMAILFAIGVAVGMSDDNDGAAGLAGLVSWLMITTLLSSAVVAMMQGVDVEAVNPAFGKIQNQFIGIVAGLIGASCYNRFKNTKLPDFLGFFSGRRCVAIVTALASIVASLVLYFVYPVIYSALVSFGESIIAMGPIGAGIYGFFNRLLIPLGLHHALNSVFWFDVAGINDIPNFLGGAKSIAEGTAVIGKTGMYQAGFFPIMMFGLLGACLAFVKTAKPENRAKISSIMLAAGFASFFTGVTEPIEFAFMFVAPGLYLLHAVLTGISVFIAASMHWMAGFGFSAGFIDLVLSTRNPLAQGWYMLIIQGLVFFVIYYVVFKFAIEKFNLKTPGREDDDVSETKETVKVTSNTELATALLPLLGGKENIINIDNCTTRLRLEVIDSAVIKDKEIKKLVPGVLKPSKSAVQVIVGPEVEFVATELKKLV